MRPIALHGHTRAITRVKYNRDGDLLFSTAKDSSPTVWNSRTGERLGTYEGHNGAVWDIDINFTSTMVATAGADQCAKVWNLLTGECVLTIPAITPVRCVGFSHGDTMLLTVTDTSFGKTPGIRVYNLPGRTPDEIKAVMTANPKMEFNPWCTYEVPEKITCALWGPTNDTIYFCSEDGTICILDVNTKKETKFCPAHQAEIRRFVFDKDYATLLTSSLDQTGKLLDSKELKVIKTYETDKPCNDCAISPLTNHIILGGGQDAQSITNISAARNKFETRFFHKVYAEELGSISGHFGPINALAFAPDGKGFATGGEDGFVRLHHFDPDYFKHSDKAAA